MKRINVSSGTPWEDIVGYSRLVRVGDIVVVTGTTATLPEGGHTGDGDPHAQTLQIVRNIERALAQVGATLAHVIRTRIYVVDIRRDWPEVARAHKQVFDAIRPATTMVEVSRLIDDWMLVEIEADAVLGIDVTDGG